jgi:hypothetical protein
MRSINEARIHNPLIVPRNLRNLGIDIGGQDSYKNLKEHVANIEKISSRGSSLNDLGLDQIEVLPKKSR